MTHADPLEMVELARGTLEADASARLLAHCAQCAECGDQLAVVFVLRRDVKPAAEPWNSWRYVRAAAALFVVALAAGLVGRAITQTNAQPITFESLATTEVPGDRLEFWRELIGGVGQASDRTGPGRQQAVVQGLDELLAGNPDSAVEHLSRCCDVGSFDQFGTTLLGVALYHANAPADRALEVLQIARVRGDGSASHMARWYIANLHLREGETSLALETLHQLAGDEQLFERRAAELLETVRSTLGVQRKDNSQ